MNTHLSKLHAFIFLCMFSLVPSSIFSLGDNDDAEIVDSADDALARVRELKTAEEAAANPNAGTPKPPKQYVVIKESADSGETKFAVMQAYRDPSTSNAYFSNRTTGQSVWVDSRQGHFHVTKLADLDNASTVAAFKAVAAARSTSASSDAAATPAANPLLSMNRGTPTDDSPSPRAAAQPSKPVADATGKARSLRRFTPSSGLFAGLETGDSTGLLGDAFSGSTSEEEGSGDESDDSSRPSRRITQARARQSSGSSPVATSIATLSPYRKSSATLPVASRRKQRFSSSTPGSSPAAPTVSPAPSPSPAPASTPVDQLKAAIATEIATLNTLAAEHETHSDKKNKAAAGFVRLQINALDDLVTVVNKPNPTESQLRAAVETVLRTRTTLEDSDNISALATQAFNKQFPSASAPTLKAAKEAALAESSEQLDDRLVALAQQKEAVKRARKVVELKQADVADAFAEFEQLKKRVEAARLSDFRRDNEWSTRFLSAASIADRQQELAEIQVQLEQALKIMRDKPMSTPTEKGAHATLATKLQLEIEDIKKRQQDLAKLQTTRTAKKEVEEVESRRIAPWRVAVADSFVNKALVGLTDARLSSREGALPTEASQTTPEGKAAAEKARNDIIRLQTKAARKAKEAFAAFPDVKSLLEATAASQNPLATPRSQRPALPVAAAAMQTTPPLMTTFDGAGQARSTEESKRGNSSASGTSPKGVAVSPVPLLAATQQHPSRPSTRRTRPEDVAARFRPQPSQEALVIEMLPVQQTFSVPKGASKKVVPLTQELARQQKDRSQPSTTRSVTSASTAMPSPASGAAPRQQRARGGGIRVLNGRQVIPHR